MIDGDTGLKPGSAGYEVALGTHVFDPLEAQSERRTRRLPRPDRADGPDPADTRIVQFVRALTAEDQARIRADHGLALSAYLPNLAYVERLDETTVRRLRADPLVRAVTHYLPEYKLDADLDTRAARPDGRLAVVASLFDGGDAALVADRAADLGAIDVTVVDDRPYGGLARVRFAAPDLAMVELLADLDDIRFVEPQPRQVTDDVPAASVMQSGHTDQRPIWDKGIRGEGQIIWLMDGGRVDIAHCFFADAPTNSASATHRKLLAVNDTSGTGVDSHATFVAGCAAGDERTNSGGNAHRGIAWAAKLWTTNYNEPSFLAELNAGFAAGARVFTNSWHDNTTTGTPDGYTQRCVDADRFTFDNEDAVLLGSSGNSSNEQGPPGTSKNAIMVSAAQSGDQPTAFGNGNAGPTVDGRRKPDLMAVGCGISSSTSGTACGTDARGCATSWATPHAAGAAALVRQYYIEGWYPTGVKTAANGFTPTGSLVKAALVGSAVDLTGIAGFPSDQEGWGLIRLDRALHFEGGRRKSLVWDVRHAAGPTAGDTRNHGFDVEQDTEELKVVLVWADPPGTSGSPLPVSNDLDLRVRSPSGTLFLGNEFTGGASTPNPVSLGDPVNNVEVVLVRNPEVGRWNIDVNAFTVANVPPGGGQGYAVVATAALKSGCFVATAVYGDPDHADVNALRAWRNRRLAAGGIRGRLMAVAAAVYRRLGPGAVVVVSHVPTLRRLLRHRILPGLARAVVHPAGTTGVSRWR